MDAYESIKKDFAEHKTTEDKVELEKRLTHFLKVWKTSQDRIMSDVMAMITCVRM